MHANYTLFREYSLPTRSWLYQLRLGAGEISIPLLIQLPKRRRILYVLPRRTLKHRIIKYVLPLCRLRFYLWADLVKILKAVHEVIFDSHLGDVVEIMGASFVA
jgi:hypothetical protein